MAKLLTDVVREIGGIEHLRELGASGNPWRYQLVRVAYDAWSVQPDLLDGQALGKSLLPVLAPIRFSRYDEVEAARRCVIACGGVVIDASALITDADKMWRTLVLLEEAIDEGVVLLATDDLTRREWWSAWAGNQQPIPGGTSSGEAFRRFVEGTARATVAAALDLCAIAPERLYVVCTDYEELRGLQWLIAEATGAAGRQRLLQRQDELHFMPSMMSLDLPYFDLPVHDLLAMQRDGLFDTWRRAVSAGLERANRLPADELVDPSSIALRHLHEALEEASYSVLMASRRSPILRAASLGSMRFGIAAAAGALGALDGSVGAATAGGGAYLLTVLTDWLGGRPTSGQRAFARLAFEITRSPSSN